MKASVSYRKKRRYREEMANSNPLDVLDGENNCEVASGSEGEWTVINKSRLPLQEGTMVLTSRYREAFCLLEIVQNCEVALCLLSLHCLTPLPPPPSSRHSGFLWPCTGRQSVWALCLFLWLPYFHQHYKSLVSLLPCRGTKINQSTNHPKVTGLDPWLCSSFQGRLRLTVVQGWCVSVWT